MRPPKRHGDELVVRRDDVAPDEREDLVEQPGAVAGVRNVRRIRNRDLWIERLVGRSPQLGQLTLYPV